MKSNKRKKGLDQTFRPKHKITKGSRIREVLEQGERYASKHFVLFMLEESENAQEEPKLGIISSKRIGHAHKRNRAKRLMREVFRIHKGWFNWGESVIIIAKKNIDLLSLSDLEKELEGVVKKKHDKSKPSTCSEDSFSPTAKNISSLHFPMDRTAV